MGQEGDTKQEDLRIGPFRVHALREGDMIAGGSIPWHAEGQAPSALGLPTIEFYDMRQDLERFPGGQFVTSYYLETLLSSPERTAGRGALVLDGGVPSWVVSGSDLKVLATWLEQVARSCLPELSQLDRSAVLARHPQLTPAVAISCDVPWPVFEIGFQEPGEACATVVPLPCPKSVLKPLCGQKVLWASDRMSFAEVDGDARGLSERMGLTLAEQSPEDLNLLAAAFPWQEATRDELKVVDTLCECEAYQSYLDGGGEYNAALWWASAAMALEELPVKPYFPSAIDWENTPEGRYGVSWAKESGDLATLEENDLDVYFDFMSYGEAMAERNGVSCGTLASVDLCAMPGAAPLEVLEALLPEAEARGGNEPLATQAAQARDACAQDRDETERESRNADERTE